MTGNNHAGVAYGAIIVQVCLIKKGNPMPGTIQVVSGAKSNNPPTNYCNILHLHNERVSLRPANLDNLKAVRIGIVVINNNCVVPSDDSPSFDARNNGWLTIYFGYLIYPPAKF